MAESAPVAQEVADLRRSLKRAEGDRDEYYRQVRDLENRLENDTSDADEYRHERDEARGSLDEVVDALQRHRVPETEPIGGAANRVLSLGGRVEFVARELAEARTLLARIAQAATERDAAEESIRHLHTIDNRRPMRSEELQAHLAQTKEAAIRRHGALARLEEALAEARKAVQR